MLRFQLFLLTLIPVALLFLAMAGLVAWQSQTLNRAITAQVEGRMLQDRQDALQAYAAIAQTAIAPYLDSSGASLPLGDRQALAKQALEAMTFGEDGYFYVYDYEGKNLVHPRLQNLVGQDLWELQDAEGDFVIQGLIGQAQSGGGYHSYIWNKPSTNLDTPKIGYAVGIAEWNWMLGTGLYLDDLAVETAAISATIDGIIASASRWFLIFGLSAVALAGIIVFAFQLRLQQRANRELQGLNKRIVDIQETQAKRISQDLHDGVSQSLVLARFSIEAAEAELAAEAPPAKTAAKTALGRAQGNLDQALEELRRVAKMLRPPALDQLGLSDALRALVRDFQIQSNFEISAQLKSFGSGLSDFSKIALFRVAQEALTNISKHAKADRVRVELFEDSGKAHLVIRDNGAGMGPQTPQGFGLQNMSERLQSLGGMLSVKSSAGRGTTLAGWVPLQAG